MQTSAKNSKRQTLAYRLAARGERLNFERKFFLDAFPLTARWYARIAKVMFDSGVLERAYISAQVLGEVASKDPEYKILIDETVKDITYDVADDLLNDPMRIVWLDKIRSWKEKAFDLGAVHALRLMGFQAEGKYTTTKAFEDHLDFELTNKQVLMNLEIMAIPAVASIMASTIKDARNTVKSTMFVKGQSVSSTMSQIKSMDNMSRAQALRIVRTETQAAYGMAVQETYSKSGVLKKEWYTVGDHRVRFVHADNEGDGAIPIDSAFSSGQIHPGDPGPGIPKHVNCRCTLIPVKGKPIFSPWTGA